MEDKKKGSVAPVLLIVLISIMVITLATFVVLFLTGMISVNLNKETNKTTNQTNQLPLTEDNVVDETEKNTYSTSDIIQINEYLKKIYSYYEVSIPEFDNINSADEDWLWAISFFEVKYTNAVLYSTLLNEAKSLFGPDLTKKLPKSELKVAFYDSKSDTFDIRGRGGNVNFPLYSITNVEKTSTGFNVEIVEYVKFIGYFGSPNDGKIYLRKASGEDDLKQFKVGEERLIEDYVLENKDQFTSKLLTLTQDAQTKQLYITSSKNILK